MFKPILILFFLYVFVKILENGNMTLTFIMGAIFAPIIYSLIKK